MHANFGLDADICSLWVKIVIFQKYSDVFLWNSGCNETNSLIGALVISRELNESDLSLASDWYAYNIIGSILFVAIKGNPVTHLKSTKIYLHNTHVYYFFVNKDGGQLE